ncbi:MAG TPA: SLC13 family permease, partial [candidate division Zixibacteria bacterium]|nr:SLC13 family permease [candidate division Zixibacteria bacterium]
RVDLIALLVLVSLVITQLVTPSEALSGFSNPAVITVWAMFVLSGGLAQTGVANNIGKQILRLAGDGELRLMLLIMLTAAILSAFMNNVGVAALLLPVVVVIARKTKTPPSRLLLPLAIGALLGGLTTLIGTPPNILISDALRDANLKPFGLFDFAPVGIAVLLAGFAFMLVVGRRLLPNRDPTRDITSTEDNNLEELYDIRDRLLVLRIPPDSILAGMSLEETQVGLTLGLNVIAVIHNGQTTLSPGPTSIIHADDQLLAVGTPDQLADLRQHRVETVERVPLSVDRVKELGIEVNRVSLHSDSGMIGKTIEESGLRANYGLNVLAVLRGDAVIRAQLASLDLEQGDCLLLQGTSENINRVSNQTGIEVKTADDNDIELLHETLLMVEIPEHSALAGRTLFESQLGSTFGLTVLTILRDEKTLLLPDPDERIIPSDRMLVQGTAENIQAIRGLEELEFDRTSPALKELETASIGMTEVVLSPHATLAGKSLSQIHFREKYSLNVLAIWRGGQAFTDDLRDMALRFGDALLLYGAREKLQLLSGEADFLVLSEEAQAPLRTKKAPLAIAVMVAVLLSVLLGWLPIAIAAVMGGAIMVLSGVLTMDEAHRYIEWPAVFLIAGMLPLGIAMQNSGAAQYLADGMMGIVGDLGPLAILAGLFILSVLASQVMPNAAVVVLMAPIALAAAVESDASPYTFLMGVAIAASASFMSPVSHPANILVMGPGGYRFSDYIRVGLPLTLVVLVVVLIVLPIVWPF